tara:strand:+ start:320048 stop:321283 length:1236 start_codon:yes stop_codon:yes gene_type:complete
MRTAIHSRITAVAASMIVACTLVFTDSASAEITWQENLRTAHAQAKAEGKLLLLHFYSDNCVWCDRLEAGSFQAPEVAETLHKSFVPVKIHGGNNPKLTQMFKVKAFPTDVIVTTEGETLSHTVSPQKANDYVAMLHRVPKAAPGPSMTMPAGSEAIASVTPKATAPSTTTAPAQAAAVPDYARNPPTANVAAAPPVATPAPQTTAPAASAPPSAVASLTLPVGNAPVANAPTPSPESGLELPSGTAGILAGARTEGMSLDVPSKASASVATTKSITDGAAMTETPELAMQGYCAVTVIKEDRWVEGDPKFGVVHLGKLYLFSNADAMQTFLADPIPYTPVLNEIDVVRFFEERKIVPGKREWGLKDPTHNRMFFFADEAAMNHFWNEYKRYTGPAIEVMNQAIADANPGT